jgi:hypothetical protein
MKNRLVIFLILWCFAGPAQTVIGVDTILKSGPISERLNLVFMGDGYDNTQTAQLVSDATSLSNYLLSVPPFSYYKNYFNVFVIKCVSPQSGISHPGNLRAR